MPYDIFNLDQIYIYLCARSFEKQFLVTQSLETTLARPLRQRTVGILGCLDIGLLEYMYRVVGIMT